VQPVDGESILPISGFPGYLVSDHGRVYSTWQSSGRGATTGGPLRPLRPVRASGRVQVSLRRSGAQVSRRVHVLVLTAFVGPRPLGMQACHFPDRDTANNHLSNLRWDTHARNQADRIYHGTSNRGVRNGSARLVPDQVVQIRQRRAMGETLSALAHAFGVSESNIRMIESRETWVWLR
jgi:hypothetical protein